MKNKAIIFLGAIVLALWVCLAVQAGESGPMEFAPPEDGLEINHIQGHSDQDLSVEFNHSSHESYACIDCHHRMGELEGKKPPRSCTSCHDNFSPDKLKGYKSYFKAMHKIRFVPNAGRPSCLNCHTNEFGSDDKDMTGCTASACHSTGIR